MLSLAVLCGSSLASPTNGGVPNAVMKKLTDGVNITRWFCYHDKTDDPDHFRGYLKRADYDVFKKLKLGFVRLCISPEVIYRDGSPVPKNLAFIDDAIKALNHAGLLVLWDLHDNGQLKLDQSSESRQKLVTFWKQIAKHYKGSSETSIVFEIVNEPTFMGNPREWFSTQQEAVNAIREIDPKRTIMVTPNLWSGIDALCAMKPLAQKNLIYTYHCYDPFFFTHQGAGWAGDPQKSLKSVPFPSSPDAVSAILPQNDSKYESNLKWYGEQRYDAKYLRSRIEKAVQWGKTHGVPTLLGEFGAYPPVAPVDSRGRWFAAMRAAVNEFKVPNALWGYDDALGFGRSLKQDGRLVLDPVPMRHMYNK